MESQKKLCKKCKRVLKSYNKVGYCFVCYPTTKEFLEFHRIYQKEKYRTDPEYREKKKKYRKKPEVREKIKLYMKEYTKKNIEKIRENKRRWYRKNYRK